MPNMKILKVEKRDRTRPPGWRRAETRSYDGKARMYIHPVGETVLENLVERHFRPVALYRELMPEILRLAGLPVDTRVVWSRTAGCACGCSPGFVVQGWTRFDVWVDVEMTPTAGERVEMAFAEAELAAVGSD